jgi:hypothetical protein
MEIIKELAAAETSSPLHSTRRVVVVSRDDGRFGWIEQYYFSNKWDGQVVAEGWVSLDMGGGIYETVEDAERNGRIEFARLHRLTTY